MLAKAGAIAATSGLADRIEFTRGDAEQLQFADQSFKTVVSLYALRHFPNPDKALREMYRCCAAGGRVLVAIGSAPPLLSAAGLQAATRRIGELGLRLLGRAPLQAPAHLDGLIERQLGHGDEGEHAAWTHGIKSFDQSLAAQMRAAGFGSVAVSWLGHAKVIDTVDEFWTLQYTLSSLARKRLQAIPREQFAALRQAFDQECSQHLARGGRLEYRSGALVATAQRPA
jgi:ubiquinone/menaquinone biosynthesis C-methylase UbiE